VRLIAPSTAAQASSREPREDFRQFMKLSILFTDIGYAGK
jgi:hypothetical protein